MVSLGVPTANVLEGRSQGLGDERDSTGAETGVGSVDAVIADKGADIGVVRVVDAEKGVKGVLVIGDSSVREELVYSKGVLPDRSRLKENCLERWGAVKGGMTSGVKDFGERGCRAPETGGRWLALVWLPISNSGFSSSIWNVEKDMHSARWCVFQAPPLGALIERSCMGGRPGIVAATCQRPFCDAKYCSSRVRLTRIHSNLLHCCHRSKLGHAGLPPAAEVVLLDPYPQSRPARGLVCFLSVLTHRQSEGLLGIQRLGRGRDKFLFGEELVFSLWLMHPPVVGLL